MNKLNGVMMKKENIHDGCCYRENCNKDIEKCCFLKTKENNCIIGGCEQWQTIE